MKTVITAAVLLASATAFTASAQGMGEGLSMLELAVDNELQRLNVQDVDPMALTLSQLAIIRGIVEGDESDNDKKRRIEAVVNR
ncbi:hypothetical protein GE300_16545 [Rhodobacteraceae bacterium 2CG4]|uniref:Uncharacterized protein n=1 Tax=Halovulum marinum TaxID=2662447 RepID=A0A6L5Z577_9RHOB|nr:hypothetical protein [Halovulum marinum]MSU91194.1 hypothetical protein [Halovulum marinum]